MVEQVFFRRTGFSDEEDAPFVNLSATGFSSLFQRAPKLQEDKDAATRMSGRSTLHFREDSAKEKYEQMLNSIYGGSIFIEMVRFCLF